MYVGGEIQLPTELFGGGARIAQPHRLFTHPGPGKAEFRVTDRVQQRADVVEDDLPRRPVLLVGTKPSSRKPSNTDSAFPDRASRASRPIGSGRPSGSRLTAPKSSTPNRPSASSRKLPGCGSACNSPTRAGLEYRNRTNSSPARSRSLRRCPPGSRSTAGCRPSIRSPACAHRGPASWECRSPGRHRRPRRRHAATRPPAGSRVPRSAGAFISRSNGLTSRPGLIAASIRASRVSWCDVRHQGGPGAGVLDLDRHLLAVRPRRRGEPVQCSPRPSGSSSKDVNRLPPVRHRGPRRARGARWRPASAGAASCNLVSATR